MLIQYRKAVYYFYLVFCIIYVACNTQEIPKCKYLIHGSPGFTVDNIDSVCKRMSQLPDRGIELYIYVSNELPENEKNISYSVLRPDSRGAILFVSFVSKKFTTIFSDSLKADNQLANRYEFDRSVFEQLKKPVSTLFFYNVIDTFAIKFGKQ